MAAKRKVRGRKGGADLSRLSKRPRRPFPPNKKKYGDGLIGPPERPGKKLRGAVKAGGRMLYDALETTANPYSLPWNKLVGPDSKLNTKNLTKRLLPGRLKDLVPTPRGKKKPPERKPKKSAPLKTWRDRMSARQNLG